MLAMAVCLLAVSPVMLAPVAGAKVPVELDLWGRPVVRVHLGSAGPYRFLLDTGSALSAVSDEVASRLGLGDAGRVATRSLGRSGSARLVRVPPVSLGRRLFIMRWMIVRDQSSVDASSQLDGVLGQDVLGRLDYLLAPREGAMWIDPPPRMVGALDGALVPLRESFAPLAVTDRRHSTEWGIDTGASHPVIFRSGLAARTGVHVEMTTSAGRQGAERLRPGSIDVGDRSFSWEDAVLHRQPDRRQAGLLPLSMFDAVYVSNRSRVVLLAPRRSGKPGRPDVAARLSALEDDGAAVGRPGGVADVAGGSAQVGQLLHLPGVRRD